MNNQTFEAHGHQTRWFENPEQEAGLRFVGASHDVIISNDCYMHSLNHKGWFVDDLQSETTHGVVYQITGKNGCARYVVGYSDPYNSGSACLTLGDVYQGDKLTDPPQYYASAIASCDQGARDAANIANQIAEQHAEQCRNYDSAWQAGRMFAELGEEVNALKVKTLALIADIRKAGKVGFDTPTICETLRDVIVEILADIQAKRDERATLKAGDYEHAYFYAGDTDLVAAFNDGATL